MKTRSGEKYEVKCKCGKFFPNRLFHNRCSQCFQKDFPDKSKKHMADHWCAASYIPIESLNEFIKMREIYDLHLMKILKGIIKDERTLKLCLPDILNHIKERFLNTDQDAVIFGFTAKNAGELYQVFRNTHKDKFGHPGGGQGSDYKWQHLFAGLIFDTWNITPDINGPIAYCYYSNFGAKPRGITSQLKCSPWMKRNITDSPFSRRNTWLENMPYGHFKTRLY
jgi:hypothetical protein